MGVIWKVIAYKTAAGREPVYEFINQLDNRTQTKIRSVVINYLSIYGIDLCPPHCKKIGPNLYELRILGKLPVRIIYCFVNREIILLHGFIKKTNKIPLKDVRCAQKRQRVVVANQ